jgi:hypothetical protein
MTDRQFGFLLKMASEGQVYSHFVVKMAAPGDHNALLGSHGMAELDRIRKEKASSRAARRTTVPTTSSTESAPAATATSTEASRPEDEFEAASAAARERYKKIMQPYFDALQPKPAPAPAAQPVTAPAPAPIPSGKSPPVASPYFDPSKATVAPNATTAERVDALARERARQAMEGRRSGLFATIPEERVPSSSTSGEPSPFETAPAATTTSTTTTRRSTRRRTPTRQSRALSEAFFQQPLERQFQLLEQAGINPGEWLRARGTARDTMVGRAAMANFKARQRARENTGVFVGGKRYVPNGEGVAIASRRRR